MGLIGKDREIELKRAQYRGYIEQHISNVRKAFDRYGVAMCVAINCDPFEVNRLIITHDMSKLSDEEFEPYRKWFYPVDESEKDKEAFDKAWEHHYKNNDHHPEYWVKYDQNDGSIIDKRRMPKTAIIHMICDWQSFMFIGGGNAYDFYYNKDRKEGLLHSDARRDLERALEVIKNTKL